MNSNKAHNYGACTIETHAFMTASFTYIPVSLLVMVSFLSSALDISDLIIKL